eukprot:COSAG01_NODE_7712_length_3089_cov_2.292308_1_plen_61_part_00
MAWGLGGVRELGGGGGFFKWWAVAGRGLVGWSRSSIMSSTALSVQEKRLAPRETRARTAR